MIVDVWRHKSTHTHTHKHRYCHCDLCQTCYHQSIRYIRTVSICGWDGWWCTALTRVHLKYILSDHLRSDFTVPFYLFNMRTENVYPRLNRSQKQEQDGNLPWVQTFVFSLLWLCRTNMWTWPFSMCSHGFLPRHNEDWMIVSWNVPGHTFVI